MSKWQRPAACSSGTCVEVWDDPTRTLVRSSLDTTAVVELTPREWADFKDAVKAGEYD